MANEIKIGVTAEFNAGSVAAGVTSLADKINQANKTQYTPISDKAVKNIDQANKAFQQLLRVDTDLRRRAKSTGQGGATFDNFNWEAAYPGRALREKKRQAAQDYIDNPGSRSGSPAGSGPDSAHAAPAPGGHGFAANTAASVAQAGLRAAGPAGGVAAGALGTGMSAGFGAGLMGLMGGMLALGVGKLVGAAMENIDKAENNSVAMDALKRTLGDVGVSFAALKSVVNSGADNLKITYEEAGKLSTQFAKLGNLSGDQYKSLAGELDVGVGMSRSFGMDPSQGMGVMGQMRGIGATTNTQDSRRFALLIGETIGKAGAFAKADEVMESMANFTTSQTRQNMGAANTAGYAGMLSSMVGSGIPGMDVAGASSMLGRVNASLTAGGAKGEASQFFTGMVGSRMGLDPVQTQILRDGGAFATNEKMFGDGSAAQRFGVDGPDGDQTFLQGSLSMLREKYGSNKGMLAQATSNHMGIGINQAMALLSVDPNEMGEMQKYGDLGKLSGSGIGNLSKSLYGSSDDRQAIASGLLGRKGADAISDPDRKALKDAMGTSQEREVLARMTAQYDQERTQGGDIRDSKNALDNIKTNIADKLLPAVNAMRDGIIYLAGNGKKSQREIVEDMITLNSKDRQRGIKADQETEVGKSTKALVGQIKALHDNREEMTPEQVKAAEAEIKATAHKIDAQNSAAESALSTELADRNQKLDNVKKSESSGNTSSDTAGPPGTGKTTLDSKTGQSANAGGPSGVGGTPAPGGIPTGATGAAGGDNRPVAVRPPEGRPRIGYSPGGSGESGLYPADRQPGMEYGAKGSEDKTPAEFSARYGAAAQKSGTALGVDPKTILGQWGLETGWGKSIIPGTNNLGNIKDFSGKGVAATDNMTGSRDKYRSYDSPDSFADDYTDLIKRKYPGAVGAKSPKAFGSALKSGGYAEDPNYANKIERAAGMAGTPLPQEAGAGRGSAESYRALMLQAEPIVIEHRNERGEQVRPSQQLSVNIRQASPFGTERYS